jgi:2-keto-4-pentenoate hydratase/2-oxohepta-3-ene-1,7-dioic acid hydratase in catechol pathway
VELTVVLGRDCKNVSEDEDPFDYIIGYTVGNDVSSRWWQIPERGNGQPAVAKSFDKFAPLGPVITSKRLIPDPTQLGVRTLVNGEPRQNSRTDDWIFNLPFLIRHLSRGTTLRKGTVIMTGTPSGVAYFMKPQAWLKDGDILETEIEGIGTMENRIVFEGNI